MTVTYKFVEFCIITSHLNVGTNKGWFQEFDLILMKAFFRTIS